MHQWFVSVIQSQGHRNHIPPNAKANWKKDTPALNECMGICGSSHPTTREDWVSESLTKRCHIWHASGNAGWEPSGLWEVWVVPRLLEVSELKETNLSLRSFMGGSPGLRAPWKRHFFMELKTSGSSISSESFENSDNSDSTCSTSL